jgi:TonB family protein
MKRITRSDTLRRWIVLVLFALSTSTGYSAQRIVTTVLSTPRPDKLPEAARLRLAGSGLFVMHVDTASGRVTSVVAAKSTGHPLLDSSAVRSFKRWRFRPRTTSEFFAPISYRADSGFGSYDATIRMPLKRGR